MCEFHVFSKLSLKNYLDNEFSESEIQNNLNKAIICGKFFSHKLNNKYNFHACDFIVYYPAYKNNLFYSEMKSEECFTNSLKWNENFFKKIRFALSEGVSKTNCYFGIYYEREESKNNTNENNNIQENSNKIENDNDEEDLFKDFDFGDEKTFLNKKKFLELHINISNQDIIAFRLDLKEVYDENPLNTIMSRLIEYEKSETLNIINKQRTLSENEIEIEKLKKILEKKEKLLEKQKREFLYKFYLLNLEKNKKIKGLSYNNKSFDNQQNNLINFDHMKNNSNIKMDICDDN